MERGSDVHNPRLDNVLQRETESFTRGEPIEARAEEFRTMEEADDEILAGALRRDDVRERSELARHLRGSIFPADRAAVVQCAIDEHAPDEIVDTLRRLPDVGVFPNVEAVWEALGGVRERRTHEDPSAAETRVIGADAIEDQSSTEEAEATTSAAEDAHVGALAIDSTHRVHEDDEVEAALRPVQEFHFRFDLVHRLAGAPFFVSPRTASVVIDRPRGILETRFGPWRVKTALVNVASATSTGPYQPVKTIGPPHLSLSDRGLTFATNDREGLCIRFHEPVRGLDPLGIVRHPAITVTVDDVNGLRAALTS
jgi:hypothetical protein